MKNLKGLLSFLLVLTILSSCFIQGVFAAGTNRNKSAGDETCEHNYEIIASSPASCTKSGENIYQCSICQDKYTEYISPTGHSMIYHAASEPTCEHKGNREYWYCENCKKTFLDKDGNTTIDSDDIELPKLDHIIESIGKTVKATHFNAGSTAGTKCSVCGKVFKKTAKIAKKTFGKITLKKGKKQFKATWKKIGGASGFQIKYSLKSNFTSAKGKTFKGRGITIKKLKSKKTYYVKVRAFKIVNKKKVYSDWSKVGSVKTK